MGEPAPLLPGDPPLMHESVADQLFLGPLERPSLDAQFPRVLGEREVVLILGKPLDVQEEDLRVAAQTRMAHDVVRSLRVAPNRRDSMPKHPGGPLDHSWVKASGPVL